MCFVLCAVDDIVTPREKRRLRTYRAGTADRPPVSTQVGVPHTRSVCMYVCMYVCVCVRVFVVAAAVRFVIIVLIGCPLLVRSEWLLSSSS